MLDAARRVVVVRDTSSPLFIIRCEKPCHADGGWCQGRDLDPPRRVCFLGSGTNEAGVRAMVGRVKGWELVA